MTDQWAAFDQEMTRLERQARREQRRARQPVPPPPAPARVNPTPRPAWEGVEDLPQIEDEQLAEANQRRRAEEMADGAQKARDRSDAMFPMGAGMIARPFVNAIGDPDRRESLGRAAQAVGEWAVSDQPILPREWFEGEAPRPSRALTRENVEALPGRIGQVAQSTGNAISDGYNWVSDQADPEAFPEGDFIGGVGTLVRDHGPGIARAITYGPWEDERRLQRELTVSRAMGEEERTDELADEANLQTAWAATNAAFAPADIPMLARGIRAVNPIGAIGREGAQVAERVATDAPRAYEGAPRPQGEVIDAPATPAESGVIGGERPLEAERIDDGRARIRTPDQRASFAGGAMVHDLDEQGRHLYAFNADNGSRIVVTVRDTPGGSVVAFSDQARAAEANPLGVTRNDWEMTGGRSQDAALQNLERVLAAVQEHAAVAQPERIYFPPASDAHWNVYRRLAGTDPGTGRPRMESIPGYRVSIDNDNRRLVLERTGEALPPASGVRNVGDADIPATLERMPLLENAGQIGVPLAAGGATGAALYAGNAEAGDGSGEAVDEFNWLGPAALGTAATAAGAYALTRGRGARNAGRIGDGLGANDRGAAERAAALLRGENSVRESTLPIGVRRTFDNIQIDDGLATRVQPTREQLFGFDPQNIERHRNPWDEPTLAVDNPIQTLPDAGGARTGNATNSARLISTDDEGTRAYEFTGPNDQRFRVFVAADGTTDFQRMGSGNGMSPVGDMSPFQARSVFRRVLDTVRQDAATHGLDEYSFRGYTDAQKAAYASDAFSPLFEPPQGYNLGAGGLNDRVWRRAQPDAGGGRLENVAHTQEQSGWWRVNIDGRQPVTYSREASPWAVDPNSWMINASGLAEADRGQKLGVRAYEAVINEARANNVGWVESGSSVSPDAQRVWESLRRRGYMVENLPEGRFRVATEQPQQRPDGGSARNIDGGVMGPGPDEGRPIFDVVDDDTRRFDEARVVTPKDIAEAPDVALFAYVITPRGRAIEIGEAAHSAWIDHIEAVTQKPIAQSGAVQITRAGDNIALRMPDNAPDKAIETAIAISQRWLREHPGDQNLMMAFGADGEAFGVNVIRELQAMRDAKRAQPNTGSGQDPLAGVAAGTIGGGAVGATMLGEAEAQDGATDENGVLLLPVLGAALGGVIGARGMRSTVGMSGARPAQSAGRIRMQAAVRDPETGRIYTGANHAEAVGNAPEAVQARLEAVYAENGADVGFTRGDEFLSRDEAMQSLGDSTSGPVRSLNDAGAQSANGARTEADLSASWPTDPEQWREVMGTHPWINSPSRAQIAIMASARDEAGRFLYSTDDILDRGVAGSSNSLNVQITRARDKGVPIPERPRGRGGATRLPGGNRLNRAVEVLESAVRSGEPMTYATLDTRLGVGDGTSRAWLAHALENPAVPDALKDRIRSAIAANPRGLGGRNNGAAAAAGVIGGGALLAASGDADAQAFDPDGQWIGDEQRRDLGDRTEIRQRFRLPSGEIYDGVRYQDHATGAISAPEFYASDEVDAPRLGDTYDASEIPLRPEEIERIEALRRERPEGSITAAPARTQADSEDDQTTPLWAAAPPIVAGIIGGRFGRRYGAARGQPRLGETAGALGAGGAVGLTEGLVTEADDAGDLAVFGAGLGAIGRGGYVAAERGARATADAAQDMRFLPTRRDPRAQLPYVGDAASGVIRSPPTQQRSRITGSLDEQDIAAEMQTRAIEQGRRRISPTPVTPQERLPLPNDARGSLANRLQRLGVEPLRDLARREGLPTDGTVRQLSERLSDAARSDPDRVIPVWQRLYPMLGIGGGIMLLGSEEAEASVGGEAPDWADEAAIGVGATAAAMLARGAAPRLMESVVPQNARMGQISRVSELPFHEPAPSRLARMAPNRMESDIDPRLILGGGLIASGPVAYGAGELLDETLWEDRRLQRRVFVDQAELRQEAMHLYMRGVTSREIRDSDPELADALEALEAGGSIGGRMLERNYESGAAP